MISKLGIYHQGAYIRCKHSDLSNRRPGSSKEQERDKENEENSKHTVSIINKKINK